MNRDQARKLTFLRDKDKCVMCGSPAQDAHHIMERRLFDDGGYDINNLVSVCGSCHIQAEQTVISPADLRVNADITKIILPPQLYPDYEYDKWGNIVNNNGSRVKGELFYDESVQKILKEGKVLDKFLPYVKYPRTYHLPFSDGRTKDDKALKDTKQFEGQEVVVTLKMDGENTSAYPDGHVHARSLDTETHPSRTWVKNFLSSKLFELPKGWRICGENLYAKHSIHYHDLRSYYYLFSIWTDRNQCLSWEDTVTWAHMLDLELPPVLYKGPWDEDLISHLHQEHHDTNPAEGFVVRNANEFAYCNFRKNVAKFVRASHVQTNKHWLRTAVVKNGLIGV